MNVSKWWRVLMSVGLLVTGLQAAAQTYPAKPVRIIVGFAAGSSIERLTRIVLEDITRRTGAVFVVEQRPGALGAIGMEAVARAAPDGYTLMPSSSATHSSGPQLSKLPMPDPRNDFTHLSTINRFDLMLVVNSASGIRSVEQLVSLARREKINYGYGSATGQVGASAFARAAGIETQVAGVAYKSQPLAITDLLGGHVQYATSDVPSISAQVRSGRLNALAVSGDKRSALFPEVPTLAELGFKVQLIGWIGLSGPAGLPQEVRDWWIRHIDTALGSDPVQEQLRTMGVEPLRVSGAAFDAMVTEQFGFWGHHIREAGIKPE